MNRTWEWEINHEFRYKSVPAAKAALLGRQDNGDIESFFDFIDPDDEDKARTAFFSGNGAPNSFKNTVCRYRHADGSMILFETSGAPLFDERETFIGFRGIERAIAGLALHSISEPTPQLETVYAMAPVALCVVDRGGRFLATNDRHTSLLSSVIGQRLSDHHPISAEKIKADFQLLDDGKTVPDHEIRIGKRDYAISVRPLSDARGNIVAISVAHFDITERRRLEQELREANQRLADLAIRDHLTGCFNRRYFDDSFARETTHLKRRGGKLSVVLIDIDNFKRYNDTYGHVAGDQCLVSVAKAMTAELHRPGDGLYRYGGEEFAVLLPETDPDGAIFVAEHLRKAVERLALPHSGNPPQNRVTISVGIASRHYSPNHLCSSSDSSLVADADEALYRAKTEGRNRVVAASLR